MKKTVKYQIRVNNQFWGTFTTSSEKAIDNYCRKQSKIFGMENILNLYDEKNNHIANYYLGSKEAKYEV